MLLPKACRLLVGSYSEMSVLAHQPYASIPGKGIYAMTLERDGTLHLTDTVEVLNPAVLIPHPDGKTLYAIVETIQEKGEVLRYTVNEKGSLDLQDSFRANGRSTCYLALSPQRDAAVIINYWDAIIDVVEVDENGRLGPLRQSFKQYHRPEGQWRQVSDREDHWGNRQVGPHAHCAHFWHEWVFIPDLGENAVFQYRYDAEKKQLLPECHIDFESDSGPRHMAMHPTLDVCYISNELLNTVCVARLDNSKPSTVKSRLTLIQSESTIDDRKKVSYVSEIALSPDAEYLYVSNRGDNSLAIFKVLDDGHLMRIGLTSSGGNFPRHFAITPCGNSVLVANQDSGIVSVFSRNIKTGLLTSTEVHCEIPAPNYIRFL
ncbi:MAG: lactonase family protein [Gammaproteobacteria bacterium]